MFKKVSIRIKVNLVVALVFLLVLAGITLFSLKQESAFMLRLAEEQVRDLTTWYFDSLNTMMLTGTMDQRAILRKKLLARPHVIDARVVRGKPVSNQFGIGFPDEQAVDKLDHKALAGESVVMLDEHNGARVLTVLTPFRATDNTRGVNCLRCHNVSSGDVNGAVRVSYSLAEKDLNIANESTISIVVNIVMFIIGLIMVNVMTHRWFTKPLNELLWVVNKRAAGDVNARVRVSTLDELGGLGRAFNIMSDNVNAITAREHNTALELQTKVNGLLDVVKRVTEGDFSAKIELNGDDAIDELAGSLQGMIDYIRLSIEEKRITVEQLQQKVDTILDVVTCAAAGDLTGQIGVAGNDAIAKLAKGVQDMIADINALVAHIQDSGVQVTSSATDISASMRQLETMVVQQASITNRITSTATEISATSKNLVNTMDEVAWVAEKATQAAVNNHSGLTKMELLMRQVAEGAGIVSEKLEIVNEKASNINSVVTTITKVADQTNLLSLNASIEAEKAGEYGRGFAVVATEIRRLADQTAVATLDIEQMIKEMQNSVSSGVQSMTHFTDRVKATVDQVQSVSKQQTQVIEQVETLGPRFESVQKSVHFQSQGAQRINQEMLKLKETAQQAVDSLRVANTAVSRLNDAAKGLHDSVSKLKVMN